MEMIIMEEHRPSDSFPWIQNCKVFKHFKLGVAAPKEFMNVDRKCLGKTKKN